MLSTCILSPRNASRKSRKKHGSGGRTKCPSRKRRGRSRPQGGVESKLTKATNQFLLTTIYLPPQNSLPHPNFLPISQKFPLLLDNRLDLSDAGKVILLVLDAGALARGGGFGLGLGLSVRGRRPSRLGLKGGVPFGRMAPIGGRRNFTGKEGARCTVLGTPNRRNRRISEFPIWRNRTCECRRGREIKGRGRLVAGREGSGGLVGVVNGRLWRSMVIGDPGRSINLGGDRSIHRDSERRHDER
jgi:hypothetical protein